MPSASTTSPFAASAAIESSLCERTMPGSVQVAISRFWLRSINEQVPDHEQPPDAGKNRISKSAPPAYPWGALLQPYARRVNDLAKARPRSGPQDRTRLHLAARKQFSGRDFLSVAELCAQHFDAPALRGDLEGLVRDFKHFADFSLHRAEGAHWMLARVEDLQLGAAERGPGARRRIAAADRVVDEVDVVRPVELRLGLAAPALVSGLRLVLHDLMMLISEDQIGRFEHRLHPHREQAVEVHRAERVVGADRGLLLQHHRAFVEAVGWAEDGEAGLALAADDRPVDRRGPAVLRQQRGVVLDGAALRDVDEILRRELQHERHDAEVDVELFQGLLCLIALQGGELEQRHALLLRRHLERIGARAGLLRRAEHARHLVLAREERLEHRPAEILLSDDRDFHAAFLGGMDSAPALFNAFILASS